MAGEPGIPRIHWCGMEGDYNIMVMDLLGPSLEMLFNMCKCRFSLKTTLMLAEQMLARIEFVHSRFYIHRDVKPDNFLMGRGDKANIVYVIDFGLAKRYRDPKSKRHIPYVSGKSLTGTARYASINTHLGAEQSRRDDLEGLCYVMIYFMRGSLPWQGLGAKNRNDKYRRIMETKVGTSAETLCKGFPRIGLFRRNFLAEFLKLLKYCRGLKFEEDPNYIYINGLLKDAFSRNKFRCDLEFDWNVRPRPKRNASYSKRPQQQMAQQRKTPPRAQGDPDSEER